jgi:hypothetical protein
MRTLILAALFVLPSCDTSHMWTPTDTAPIRQAKMQCAEATRQSLPEPACGPADYVWASGEPMLTYRDQGGAPRCSYVDTNRYAGQFTPSYRACLAKAGIPH